MLPKTYYAIQHIPSGKCLPAPKLGSWSNTTYLEPTSKGIPRLFRHRQDAVCALKYWLSGHMKKQVDHKVSQHSKLIAIPVAGRTSTDMKIIRVTLNAT